MTQKIRKMILDHLLSQNDWMQTKLIEHKNKVVVIEISGLKIILKIDENGLLHSLNKSEDIDCIIKLTVNDFINQIINNFDCIYICHIRTPKTHNEEYALLKGFCHVQILADRFLSSIYKSIST